MWKLRSVLSLPRAYDFLQSALGARAGRDAFVREHVRPRRTDRVLDIGCGPATMLPHLDVAEYVGFDASERYIDAAKKQYKGRGTFICERVSKKTLKDPGTYDVVLGCGILHHLDDPEAHALFAIAREALRPGGRLVTLDCAYVENQSRAARYVISRDRGEYVRHHHAYGDIARATFDDVTSHVRSDLLRIPYTHVVLECTSPSTV